MRSTLVTMQALSFFTVNSPTTGSILHGDARENADVLARYPQVSEDDADYLEEAGLAERYDGRVPKEGERAPRAETVDERAGRKADEHREADQSVDQPTGLDTRGSTAFEREPHVLAGESSSGRQMLDADDGGKPAAEDEAPATGKNKAGAGKAGGSKSE